MICPGKGQYRDKIKSLALKVKNLEFIDSVHFNDIDKYFKNAKIFISTSIYEGFPNTFVQAAKNSTPIVSLNINPDNILNDFFIGFHSQNFAQLKDDLKTLLYDKQLYNKISNNSYEYAKDNHNIEKIGQQFEDILLNF